MGEGKSRREFPGGGIVRSEDQSASRLLVFASRAVALATGARSDTVCSRRIQCRGEPGATLGGGRGGAAHGRELVSAEHRFSGHAQVCRGDRRSIPFLPTPGTNVKGG